MRVRSIRALLYRLFIFSPMTELKVRKSIENQNLLQCFTKIFHKQQIKLRMFVIKTEDNNDIGMQTEC